MEFNICDLTKIESADSITAIDNYWDSYSKHYFKTSVIEKNRLSFEEWVKIEEEKEL